MLGDRLLRLIEREIEEIDALVVRSAPLFTIPDGETHPLSALLRSRRF